MDGIEREATPAEQPLVSSEDMTEAGMDAASIPVDAASGGDDTGRVDGEAAPGGWARMLRWFSGAAGRDAQIAALSDAIADAPDAPMNYALRGELLLDNKAYAAARADFERALTLAERALRTDRWGLVAQAAQDRAAAGLADALRHLGAQGEPIQAGAGIVSEDTPGTAILAPERA